ncbi:MAG TPA: hypothetical protein V6C57_01150 [Coleofasciculaceae cyanobacterium]
MLSGFGFPAIITRDLDATTIAQNLMFNIPLVTFNYEQNTDVKEALKWQAGQQVVADSARGRQTNTLTLGYESIDWFGLQFAFDQLAVDTTATLPLVKQGTVPTSGPYTFSDTTLVSGNIASVKVYIDERGDWGPPGFRKAGTTTPAVGEFVAATGTLTFNAADAGAPFTYVVDTTYTDISSIGAAASPIKVGTLSFVGQLYGPRFPENVMIYFRSITRKSDPSINTDDVPRIEIQYSANLVAGRSLPFELYELSTAA